MFFYFFKKNLKNFVKTLDKHMGGGVKLFIAKGMLHKAGGS